MKAKATDSPLAIAAPDTLHAVERWRRHLAGERRLAVRTVEAYSRDVAQFLAFLTMHLGGLTTLDDLPALAITDLRAFMAARRNHDASSRTLARGLAGIRSFIGFLEKEGRARGAPFRAIRAPRHGARRCGRTSSS